MSVIVWQWLGTRSMVRPLLWLVAAIILGSMLAPEPLEAAFPMVASGRAAPILLVRDAPDEVEAAVVDLRELIARATGVTPEVRRIGRPIDPDRGDLYGIVVGRAAALAVSEGELGYDGYRILTTDRLIRLAGPNAAGTANAVYDLLETALGVRFLVPGEDGIVVPSLREVAVPASDRREKPAFAIRLPWYNEAVLRAYPEELRRELRLFVRRNRGIGMHAVTAHYFATMVPPERTFADHPEYFAEVQGRRIPHGQLCTSNPDVVRLAVEHWERRFAREPDLRIGSLTPNDGGLYCTCAACELQSPDLPTRLIEFMNEVTRRVTRPYPDRLMTFYAYGPLTAPVDVELHPNLIPAVTPYQVCEAHDLEDQACSSNSTFREQLEGWRRLSRRFLVREYACWWHAPDLATNVLASNLRAYERRGALGVSREYLHRGFGSDLMRYLDVRLMWDPSEDVDQIIDNFLSARFGPAAAGMRDVVDRFRDRLEGTPPSQLVRGGEVEIDRVYDLPMFEEAVADLDRLVQQTEGVYADRVRREADLLHASLDFRRVTDLTHRYSVTGSNADLETLLDAIDAAARRFERLEQAGTLGSSFTRDIADLRERATGEGLTAPLDGAFVYTDDLRHGGFSRRDATSIEGFYAGQYGLALLPGRSGRIAYELRAAPGKRFERAELTHLVFPAPASRIEVLVGGERHVFAENRRFSDLQLTYDLTALVRGADAFTIAFAATNPGSRPELCLDSWGIRGEVR